MDTFPKRYISFTLTGEQWFALLASASGKVLSAKGVKLRVDVTTALAAQLQAEADEPDQDKAQLQRLCAVLRTYVTGDDGSIEDTNEFVQMVFDRWSEDVDDSSVIATHGRK